LGLRRRHGVGRATRRRMIYTHTHIHIYIHKDTHIYTTIYPRIYIAKNVPLGCGRATAQVAPHDEGSYIHIPIHINAYIYIRRDAYIDIRLYIPYRYLVKSAPVGLRRRPVAGRATRRRILYVHINVYTYIYIHKDTYIYIDTYTYDYIFPVDKRTVGAAAAPRRRSRHTT